MIIRPQISDLRKKSAIGVGEAALRSKRRLKSRTVLQVSAVLLRNLTRRKIRANLASIDSKVIMYTNRIKPTCCVLWWLGVSPFQ